MDLFKIEANYIDIFNKEIYPASIAIANGHIASIEKLMRHWMNMCCQDLLMRIYI